MFSVRQSCPICVNGIVGFRVCTDQDVMFIMCDECDTVWLRPDTMSSIEALYLKPPDYRIPTSDCSLFTSRWATREEIERHGWERFINGEGTGLDEVSPSSDASKRRRNQTITNSKDGLPQTALEG